jgi:hypothetical protein
MKARYLLLTPLVLAGCASGNSAVTDALNKANQAVADSGPTVQNVCAALSYAHLAFTIAAPLAKISAADQAKEAQIMDLVVNPTCANPPTDVASALKTLMNAYASITTGTNTGTVPPVATPTSS